MRKGRLFFFKVFVVMEVYFVVVMEIVVIYIDRESVEGLGEFIASVVKGIGYMVVVRVSVFFGVFVVFILVSFYIADSS